MFNVQATELYKRISPLNLSYLYELLQTIQGTIFYKGFPNHVDSAIYQYIETEGAVKNYLILCFLAVTESRGGPGQQVHVVEEQTVCCPPMGFLAAAC